MRSKKGVGTDRDICRRQGRVVGQRRTLVCHIYHLLFMVAFLAKSHVSLGHLFTGILAHLLPENSIKFHGLGSGFCHFGLDEMVNLSPLVKWDTSGLQNFGYLVPVAVHIIVIMYGVGRRNDASVDFEESYERFGPSRDVDVCLDGSENHPDLIIVETIHIGSIDCNNLLTFLQFRRREEASLDDFRDLDAIVFDGPP